MVWSCLQPRVASVTSVTEAVDATAWLLFSVFTLACSRREVGHSSLLHGKRHAVLQNTLSNVLTRVQSHLSALHTLSLHIFRVVSVVQEKLGQALKAFPLLIQVHLRLPHHVHQDCVVHLVQQHLLG